MANDNYEVKANPNLQGYDLVKRDGVINPDGTKSPETICTFYSMEYLKPLLETLRSVDAEKAPTPVVRRSPVYEG